MSSPKPKNFQQISINSEDNRKMVKSDHTTSSLDNRGLTARTMWLRTVVICFSIWLVLGSFFEQASISYAALMGQSASYTLKETKSEIKDNGSSGDQTNLNTVVETSAAAFVSALSQVRVSETKSQMSNENTNNLPPATPGFSSKYEESSSLIGSGKIINENDSIQNLKSSYGQLPISFELNQGQVDDAVKFLARGQGYSLFLTHDKASIQLTSAVQSNETTQNQKDSICQLSNTESGCPLVKQAESQNITVLNLNLIGANSKAQVVGEKELPGKSNYFIGNDKSKWRTNIPNYGQITYKDIYPGIDLTYYGNQGQLEYDFIVAQGADPALINFAFEGAEKTEISANGDLLIHSGDAVLHQKAPLLYQVLADGTKQTVNGFYSDKGSNKFGFNLSEKYDISRPLVIDPVLFYSTYLGGNGNDSGASVAVDTNGFIYLAGNTSSANFITTTGAYSTTFAGGFGDTFVTKITPGGDNKVYSTYLGGNGQDSSQAVALDNQNNLFIAGYTDSANFPTKSPSSSGPFQSSNPSGYASFITKLNSSGSDLVFSTLLDDAFIQDIAIDGDGYSYVTGGVQSSHYTNFPTVNAIKTTINGSSDAFVTKVNQDGSQLVFSTFLGGGAYDWSAAIAVDQLHNVYLTGDTYSNSTYTSTNPLKFPVTSDAYQSDFSNTTSTFLTKINFNGNAISYSTFYGGNDQSFSGNSSAGRSIAVDNNENAFIVGYSKGSIPTTPGAIQSYSDLSLVQDSSQHYLNGYIAKISTKSSNSGLKYATMVGGSSTTLAKNVKIQSDGMLYAAGQTLAKSGFPITNALQTTANPNSTDVDGFLLKLNTNITGTQSLLYSSFLGVVLPNINTALGSPINSSSLKLTVDYSNNVYVVGNTAGSLQTTIGALQTSYGGGSSDSFIRKYSLAPNPPVIVDLDISQPNALTFVNAAPALGGSLTSTLRISNIGNVPVTATLLLTDTVDGSVINSTSQSITNILPYTIRTVTSTLTVSNPIGSHRLCAQIVGAVPAEDRTDNNFACSYFNVIDPNIPTQFSLSVSAQRLDTWQGAKPTLLAVVKNTGTASTTITQAIISGPSYITGTLITPLPITNIAPGAQVELSFAVEVAPQITPVPSFPLSDTLNILVSGSAGSNPPIPGSASTWLPVWIAQQPSTTLTVTVKDEATTSPIPNTLLMVEGGEKLYQTDSNGVAVLDVLPGPRNLYGYAPGYLPVANEIDVPEGTSQQYQLNLKLGNALTISDVTPIELTADQAKSRGINLADLANNRYYDFVVTVQLGAFGSGYCECTIPSVPVPTSPVTNTVYTIPPVTITPSTGGGGSGSVGAPITIMGSFTYPTPDQRIENLIVIPGTIQFPKQFWEVKAFVYNRALTFRDPQDIIITNTRATISFIPNSGLTLPSLLNNPQSFMQTFTSTIPSNQGRSVSWVVRGDSPGAYQIKVDTNGDLKFKGVTTTIPIYNTSTSNPIYVYQPTLNVTYILPAAYTQGTLFTLKLEITNSSPISLTGVVVAIKPEDLIGVTISGKISDTIASILPNQTQEVTFNFIPNVEGCAVKPESFVATSLGIVPTIEWQPNALCPGAVTYCYGCASHPVGEPINPAVGNYFTENQDIVLKAPTGSYLDLELTREYNSLDTSIGLFGKGWRSSYDTQLLFGRPNGPVIVVNPGGRQDVYHPITTTTYLTPPLANATLIKTPTEYTLTKANGVIYHYKLDGSLDNITDRNNNKLQLNYTSGNLHTVTDNYGRTLTFNVVASRVQSITDGSRTVYYTYTSNIYLTGASDIRDSSKSTTYQYDPATNLINKVFNQDSKQILENIYDAKNRVKQQNHFDGLGAEYSIYFDYDSISRATVYTDARGYKTIYYLDPAKAQVTKVTDALGQDSYAQLNTNFDPIVITSTNGRVEYLNYNAFGKPTDYSTTVDVPGSGTQTITTTLAYNQFNDPTTFIDQRGNKYSYNYDTKGNLTGVTDPLNQTNQLEYDPSHSGRATKITSFNGLVTTVSYDSLGYPSAITQTQTTLATDNGTTPKANVSYRTDFQYSAQGWLTYKSDPYDTANPPSPIPGMRYDYDPSGRLTTATNLLGNNQVGRQAVNTYDPAGNLASETNFMGQTTTYVHDVLGRLITTTQFISNGTGNLVTVYGHDQSGNITTEKDPRGIFTYYTYDKLDRVTSITRTLQSGAIVATTASYDRFNNTFVTQTNSTSGGAGDQVTYYQYDSQERLVTTTLGYGTGSNARNYQQVNIYDKASNLVGQKQSKIPAAAITNWNDPAQVVSILTTFDPLNRPQTISANAWNQATGDKTLVTNYSYNDPQNRWSLTDPYGIVTTYENDPAGRLISTTVTPAPTQGAVQSGAQVSTSYNFYDSRDFLIRTINGEGNRQDFTYDILERPTSSTVYTDSLNPASGLTTTLYYVDNPQNQIIAIGPAPQYQRRELKMDEAGRIISSTVFANSAPVAYPTVPSNPITTLYEYDGQSNLTKVTEASNNNYATSYNYEATGWLNSVVQTTTVQNQVVTNTTNYQYDLVGNRIGQNTNGQFPSTYSYDVLNRLVGQTDGVNNTQQFSYDGLDRMVSKTDGKEQISGFTYDNTSRLTKITSPGSLNTTYTFNDAGVPITMVDTSPAITTNYAYDGLARLVSSTSPQGIVKYSYDKLDRRDSLYFGPAGTPDNQLKQVKYFYDGLDRLVKMSGWQNQVITNTYSGPVPNQTLYSNGINSTFTYDSAYRLTGINQEKSGSNVFSATYALDNRGNKTDISEGLNGVVSKIKYGYDEDSRLTLEARQVVGAQAPPITSTYSYDNVSNRTSLVTNLSSNVKMGTTPLTMTTVYTYNQASQLTNRTETGSSTPFSGYTYDYGYDQNGSLVSELNNTNGVSGELTSYGYDSRNRLTGWQKSKDKNATTLLSTASFSYDGNDTRLQMGYNGQTTSYLQDVAGDYPVVLQEKVGSQTNPTSYLYAPDSTSPIFETDPNGIGLWDHLDDLGSVRALSNASSGQISNTYSYSAFGLNTQASGKANNTHQLGGEQLDPTGLYYQRARYYQPSLGRFVSQDSFGGFANAPTTLNRYIYGNGNPASYTDPSGNFSDIENVATHLYGIAVYAENGFDSDKATQQLIREASKNKKLAENIFCANAWGYQRAIDFLMETLVDLGTRMMPGVSFIRAVIEGVTGYDLITGHKLSDFDRIFNFATSLFDFLTLLKGPAEGVGLLDDVKARHPESGIDDAKVGPSYSCANSFSSDTPVATDQGEKPIGQIKEGDKVEAYDQDTGATGYYTVTAVLVHLDPAIEELTIDGETLETTPEHPFFTENNGWVVARDLKAGDKIRKADGTYGEVQSLEVVQTQQEMYNLTVADVHTFFVGEEQWIVHNAPCKGGTYKLTDPQTGQVMRTGRTNDLNRRRLEHARAPSTKGLNFNVDRRTDDYAEQRGREQFLDNFYNHPPLNHVRGVDPRHKKAIYYFLAAKKFEYM